MKVTLERFIPVYRWSSSSMKEKAMSVNDSAQWYRLGFHYRWDEALFDWRNKEEEGFAPSALCTRTAIRVSFVDRLRLLVSGHCEVTAYTKTDKPIDRAVTRAQFAILPPSS